MDISNKNENIRNLPATISKGLQRAAQKVGFQTLDPETEFLPAALEVLETPPSPAGRVLILLICFFFCIAVVWSAIGKVDIIATASGKVVPAGRSKVIQPVATGVVRDILVDDGQKVKAGQVLVKIDTTISQAEQNRLHDEMIAAELDTARLKAALKMSADPEKYFVPPKGATQQQIQIEEAQLTDQVQNIRSKLSDLDSQISENEGNQAAVQATIDKLQQSIPLIQQREQMRAYLSGKGYGSKLNTLQTEQDLDEHEADLKVQQGRLQQAAGGVSALKAQRQQTEADFKQKTLDELAQAEVKAASLGQQYIQATERNRQQTLTAPVTGTVQQLAIHTVGGVVTPAEALMKIVPADGKLEVRAMIRNQDIGFVHVGQGAAVKVATFDFTQYGFMHGKIQSISQDAIVQQALPAQGNGAPSGSNASGDNSQAQGLVYATDVALNKPWMNIHGRRVRLEPGMAVTVEIKTGKRSILDYLLSPLARYKEDSLHER